MGIEVHSPGSCKVCRASLRLPGIAGAGLATDVGGFYLKGELAALELLSVALPADPARQQDCRILDRTPASCFLTAISRRGNRSDGLGHMMKALLSNYCRH